MSRLVLAENKNQPPKAKSFKFGELNFRGMHFLATWVRGRIIAACLLFVVRDLKNFVPVFRSVKEKLRGGGQEESRNSKLDFRASEMDRLMTTFQVEK